MLMQVILACTKLCKRMIVIQETFIDATASF